MILLNKGFNINLSFLAVYPELYLIIAVLLILSFLVILDNLFDYKFALMKISGYLFVYTLIYVIILNSPLCETDWNVFHESLVVTETKILVKDFIAILLILITMLSFSYFKYEKLYTYEFFILLNFVLIGLFVIISANDLLVMYIGIELLTLSFYLLTTLKVYSNFSTEAGLKYFILGAFSSGLLLYGSSLIYGSLGTISFSDFENIVRVTKYAQLYTESYKMSDSLVVGFLFVIIGIFFKLGAAPFHMWLPDVYEGAPTIVTLIFSIVPKIAIFLLFYNLNSTLIELDIYFFNDLLYYVALLSIIVGSLGALYQVKIKRLLAYSAINHVGFLLIAFLTFTNSSIFSLFFYLLVYILISLNIFIVILILRKYNNNLKLKKINEYVLIFKTHPILAINFSLILFSIAGIPPLVGFYSKLYIFITALNSKLYLIVIIAAVFSVIACLYYIRLIKLMFFKTFEYWFLSVKINKFESLLLSITLMFNILFFCYPDIIVPWLYSLAWIVMLT